jgi:hypothetical protein
LFCNNPITMSEMKLLMQKPMMSKCATFSGLSHISEGGDRYLWSSSGMIIRR